MRKKLIGPTLAAMLFALCSSAVAQQPKKVPRTGYLSQYDAAAESARFEPFRRALRELGYIEGKNIAIEFRGGERKPDRLTALAAELVRLKVDSLARPGGNVTGITTLSRELGGKRLELLKEAITKVARVVVLYEPAVRPSQIEVKEILPVAARSLGLTIQPWEVRGVDDFDRVFVTMGKQRSDGLYVTTGPLMSTNQKRIADFALKSRLPSVYGIREAVDAGGLMFYGADLADSHRRVAYYVDKS